MSTDRPPNPLLALAGGALEEVLNRTLALDPASAQRIAPLEGRSVELSWSAADLGLRLDVNDGRLRVGPRARGPAPDLSLASTLSGLAGMLLPGAAGGGLHKAVLFIAQRQRQAVDLGFGGDGYGCVGGQIEE